MMAETKGWSGYAMEITVNTNLADSIVKIVNDICEKFGIVFDWTSANVWPKLQELMVKFISYRVALDWFGIFFPLGFAVLFLILGIVARKKDWNYNLEKFFWVMFGISAVAQN